MTPSARFDPISVRRQLSSKGPDHGRFILHTYRPMDCRWLYWEPETKLLDEKRAEYVTTVPADTAQLVLSQGARRGFDAPLISHMPVARHAIERGANVFPSRCAVGSGGLLDQAEPNLSSRAREYLTCVESPDDSELLLRHILATTHSPAYREENEFLLASSWPQIPLPAGASALRESAHLGQRIEELFAGQPPLRLVVLGVLSSVADAFDPSTDLAVTARWGIGGKGGITMPSTGRLTERDYTADELAAIAEHAESLGMSRDQAAALLGETCYDVYLNDVAYWRCVPTNVWRYTIGGYQVIKKWLSYRERALLGRDLKSEEARYVTEMVRRIAALVLMGSELDANYERVKADAWEWGE